jgi:hypothetical protein
MDASTVAFNMTFVMTLGIGFLVFLAQVFIFTGVLMLAGAARLAAIIIAALWKLAPDGRGDDPNLPVIGQHCGPRRFLIWITRPTALHDRLIERSDQHVGNWCTPQCVPH